MKKIQVSYGIENERVDEINYSSIKNSKNILM